MNHNFFYLLYNHLEERQYNNISQNVRKDADYLKATHQEQKIRSQYKNHKETIFSFDFGCP